MKRLTQIVLATVALVLLGAAGVVAQNTGGDPDTQSLRDKLSRSLGAASQGQLQVVAVRQTPMAGLLEVELNSGELLFSDRSGDFLVSGDLFRTSEQGLVNLSAETRKLKIVEMIAAVPEDEMIIFSPAGETKAQISVFTDVDCTYCRKLHGDIEEILARGIEVRYLAFPRGGPTSAVYPKMISVWCSPDQQRAITQAKHGQNIPERECDNPVRSHFELGNRVGISGTPALVLKDGTVIPGYLDVERLTQMVLASE